jgi:hypothetical protein
MKRAVVLLILAGVITLIAGCALPVGDDYRNPVSGTVSTMSIAEYNLRIYVPIPVAGETPVKTITTRTDMDITVVWKDDQGVDITGSLSAFVENQVYQADITLTTKNDYAFDEAINFKYIPADCVTVQPGDNLSPAVRSLSTVTYKPAKPPQPIDGSLDLTPYISRPVTNATPVLSFAAPQYSGTVEWKTTLGDEPLTGPFLPGVGYTAMVNLSAASGYIFTGIPVSGSGSFTHSAAVPTFEINAESPAKGKVIIAFGETDLLPVSDYNLQNYVPVPVEGQRPVTTVNRSELSGTVTWYDNTGQAISNPASYAFLLNAVYQADITLTPKAGYTFNPAENFRYPNNTVATQPNNDPAVSTRTLSRVVYHPTPAPTVVTLLDLTACLPKPVSGGTPAATISTPQYTGSVSWSPVEAGGLFLPNKAYTATVQLAVVSGYTFNGVSAFSHGDASGAPQFTPLGGGTQGTVVIVFPATSSLAIPGYNLASYIPLPVAGQPLIRSAAFPGMTVSVVWKKNNTAVNDTVFQSDDVYQADITLTAGAGYAFAQAFSYNPSNVVVNQTSDNNYYAQTVTVTYKPVPRAILSFGSDNTTPNSAMKMLLDNRSSSSLEITLPAGMEMVPAGFTFTNGTSSPATVVIDGGGRVLQLANNGAILTVGDGVTLTLRNITLRGHSANNSVLVCVAAGGKLCLKNGAVIKDNNNITTVPLSPEERGGGVNVYGSGAELVLDGGTITGNAAYQGNTVFISEGTFTMERGAISDNFNTAVVCSDGAFFELKGGTISGNTEPAANRAYGGGVIIDNSTFTMSGGTISNNTVTNSPHAEGGGVSVANNSNFEMTGGTISDNYMPYGGGGVCVATGSNFEMTGGTIRNNTSPRGGGVIASGGTTTIAGGTIMYNIADGQDGGGGVYVWNGGTVEMKGGTIRNNTAPKGGGVFVEYNGTFTIEDGNIWSNTALHGGGVYVSGLSTPAGDLTLKGGTIMYNTASLGGGVYVYINNNYYISFHMEDAGSVHIGNPVYLEGPYGFGTKISISGTLTNNPAANITTDVSSPSQQYVLLEGDITTDNNYTKFLYDGQPGKIDTDGKYILP